ncbi:hypothetical protein QTN25_001904 [Entamoeba marina]
MTKCVRDHNLDDELNSNTRAIQSYNDIETHTFGLLFVLMLSEQTEVSFSFDTSKTIPSVGFHFLQINGSLYDEYTISELGKLFVEKECDEINIVPSILNSKLLRFYGLMHICCSLDYKVELIQLISELDTSKTEIGINFTQNTRWTFGNFHSFE